MTTPSADVLLGVQHAHARVVETARRLTDDDVRRASLLPEWTVGHVLTHLARNADSFVHLLDAAARGEVEDQYPGGPPRRAADIEAGASRPAAELATDVADSAARLEAAFAAAAAAGPERWAAAGRSGAGPVTMGDLPARRWREVEIHHADLGLAFTTADWSDAFVAHELRNQVMRYRASQAMGLTELPPAALALSPHERLAWLVGRSQPEGLPAVGFG
jgi:maleylpyruvate isomerase